MQTQIDQTHEFRYDVSERTTILLISCAILVATTIWGAFRLPKPHFVRLLIYNACIGALLVPAGMKLLEARKRLTHRIIVTPGGVIFDDGRQHIEASWNEITELRTEPLFLHFKRYIVVTANGTFDFISELKGFRTLRRLLARLAVNAEKKGWKV